MRKTAAALAPLVLTACAFQVEDLDVLDNPRDEVPDPRQTDQDSTPGDLDDIDDPDTTPQPNEPLPAWDPTRHFVAASGDRFAGTLGSSQNIDLPADLALVYDDGWYTQVEVYALRSDNTRVMLSMAVSTSDGQPFFKPGLGFKFRPGRVGNADVWSLACEGPASGSTQMGTIFAETPYDEEPCEVGVDTEQDPENPGALVVTLAATFAEDCEDVPGGEDGEDGGDPGVDLPDDDGDGDGDLPPPGEGGGEGGSDGTTPGGDSGSGGAGPLSASASFRLLQ